MTTALAERPTTAPAVTPEQIDLIKRTVANGATADELKLYLYDCARQGVHPLDKLIHFTKRGGKYTPITSIDFMRTRAADTGDYAGSDDASFHFELLANGAPDYVKPPRSATVTVWRLVQGQRCPFTATARWSEYKPAENDFMWQKMPHTMLAKCAEALALRKGFPRQLAGLYAKEELDQAGSDRGGYTVEAPPVPVVRESGSARSGGDAPGAEPVGAAVHVSGVPEGLDRTGPVADDALRIIRVDHKATKNQNVTKFVVVLSDGREVSTIKTPLGTLAEQLCQDGDAVEVETKSTKWGDDLIALRRRHAFVDVEHGEPLSEDDIPFDDSGYDYSGGGR